MRLGRPSLQTELDRFFQSISKSPDDFNSVSKSAFTQARRKLRPEAFIELTDSQLDYFQQNFPYKKDWLGKRVVAIDGSTVLLPSSTELKAHFDSRNIADHYNHLMASISTAYDVTNQLVLDAQIEPYGTSELSMAECHLNKLTTNDILVMDRGYACLWLFSLLKKRNINFCIRLSTKWKDAIGIIKEGECDIDWHPRNKSKQRNPKFDQYQIDASLSGLRLVCLELENGEKEVLATSLIDREAFPLSKLKELYHLRWQIEENYKFLKHVVEIEHFSGKSVQAIKQDFYARIFMANMTSMISNELLHERVNAKNNNEHTYQVNRTQAMVKVKDMTVQMFRALHPKDWLIQLEKLLKRAVSIVRPKRKYPRNIKSSAIKKNMNYRGL